jgi:hypothetical protein
MSQYPSWSPPEAEYLDRLVGDLPFPELVARFHRQAQRQGWPPRTERAILARLRRTGQRASGRCGAYLTTGAAAELLGCPGTRVEAWLRQRRVRDILQPIWAGKTRYIERKAWRRLARERPQVLGGFPADVLFLLLEDRELAESVASRYRAAMGDWRIRCIENGRIYRSASAAARELHVTQSAISLAIKQRRPVRALGLTFEALRSAADPPQPLRVRNRAA